MVAAGDGGRPGVILDRDGTLIDFVRDPELGSVTPAFTPGQLRFLPGALPALALFRDAGFVLAVATNQPQAAKGQLPASAIARTNEALRGALAAAGIPLGGFEVCLHHPDGGPGGDASLVRACECRKPAAGMLEALVRELHLDRSRTWMIGDTAADLAAARAAGVRCALLLEPGRCELCPLHPGRGAAPGAPDVASGDWATLAAEIIRRKDVSGGSTLG